MQSPYRPRIIDATLRELVEDIPTVSLIGPRASGKTRQLEEPILIDEWQEAPAVLGAVKRAVDADELGARFVHGLVLHAGPHLFSLSERITAAPIGALWS